MISNILVIPFALLVGASMDRFKGWIIVIINASICCFSLTLMLIATDIESDQTKHSLIFIGLCGSMIFGITTFLVVKFFSNNSKLFK